MFILSVILNTVIYWKPVFCMLKPVPVQLAAQLLMSENIVLKYAFTFTSVLNKKFFADEYVCFALLYDQ